MSIDSKFLSAIIAFKKDIIGENAMETVQKQNKEKDYIYDLFNELKTKITSKFITKYNYSYYLNSIDEPPLHLLLLTILSLYDNIQDTIIIDFFNYGII